MRARLEADALGLQRFEYDDKDPEVAVAPDPLILARAAELRRFLEED